ncbi:MAG: IS110 family transposase [Sphingomonas phyllosphaerae]
MTRSANPATDAAATTPTGFVGCDVGKAGIAVFDSVTGRATTIANTPLALDAFAAALPPGRLLVCEATGGYEAALLAAASRAGHAIHRADARRVKAFIRSLGTLAKTDALDARALARYGQERHERLDRWHPRDEHRQELATLVNTRSDLVRARTACTNRLKAPGAGPVAAELRALVAAHDQAIAALEARIEALLAGCASLARTASVLRTIPGIGATTAAALIALLPELGTLGRRQIASLAGLAPHPRQSGTVDGYRRTRGGRPEVRRVTFMAALSAVRFAPDIKAFYQRLRDSGKKPIVALTAAMRKLITIANAKIRDDAAQLS